MNKEMLQSALRDIPLGGLRYFEKVGSTNDIALAWAEDNARDFSLVIANEQTTGRGRSGRSWQTPPDSALALSLILLPKNNESQNISLFTGLGALALANALEANYTLKPEIKWPNDILINGKKVAGILVEVRWIGEKAKGIVLGMGVNVRASAVPPEGELQFPATSLDEALGKPVDRVKVLQEILTAFLKWRPLLGGEKMVAAWDELLAFRGKQVEIKARDGQVIHGSVMGLNPDGSLRLDTVESIHFGDVHLRPTQL